MSFAGIVALAVKLLRRDYRAGELTLIALAIVVAVAGVTTVGFFTDRVQRVLEVQANRLLGADLVIADSRPISPELSQEALRRGLAAIEIGFDQAETASALFEAQGLRPVVANDLSNRPRALIIKG